MQEREKRARISWRCLICESGTHPSEKCPKKCLCGGWHVSDSHAQDNCLGCVANSLFSQEEIGECPHFPFSEKTKILVDQDVSRFVERFLAGQQ